MNKLNHFLFSLAVCLIIFDINLKNLALIIIFSFLFGIAIDIDHVINKKAPWYRKRTWVQEPFGLIILGVPIALLLGLIDKKFILLVLIPYSTHIILDYLCIFEAFPLAPFSKVKKKEGKGLFIPDSLFSKSNVYKMWKERVMKKNINGISENYFTVFCIVFLSIILILKII